MRFNEYQKEANRTDQQPESGDRPVLMMIPLMGLAGEVGELLAEHKKWLRDGQSHKLFPERVTEELGDILWYLSNIAAKQGFHLGEIALAELNGELRQTDVEMGEYQRMVEQADAQPASPENDQDALLPLLGLAGRAGALLDDFGEWLQKGTPDPVHHEELKGSLSRVLRQMTTIAVRHQLQLEEVARCNLEKISRRWGQRSQWEHHELLDQDYPEHERLPRTMEIFIRPDGPGRTVTLVNGKRFGDPLTDNHYRDDGYRFHDIFHLSFASMLGWSPTTRALLRRKRRSNPVVDETEDGGRAMVLEEGIAAFVFDYAARRNFLEGIDRVDYKLLRNIRDLTEHLEVARRTEADWERAIVRGFQIWRAVRAAGEGHISADLERGEIWMADTTHPATGSRMPHQCVS